MVFINCAESFATIYRWGFPQLLSMRERSETLTAASDVLPAMAERCRPGRLPQRPRQAAPADSHSVPHRLPAQGEPQSRGAELLPFNAPHPSAASPRDLPTQLLPITNPSDLFTVIQRAFLLSQSLAHLCLGDALN